MPLTLDSAGSIGTRHYEISYRAHYKRGMNGKENLEFLRILLHSCLPCYCTGNTSIKRTEKVNAICRKIICEEARLVVQL